MHALLRTHLPALAGLPVWGWLRGRRARLLRRWLAAGLLLTGSLALLLPASARGAPGTPTVVTVRDLPAGTVLHATDVRLAELPDPVRPTGALGDPSVLEGRLLAGPARAGEPLTDVRLVGESIPGTGDPTTSTVPVRLADAGVAELLRPGRRVDVVAAAEAGSPASVLASQAVVVTVGRAETGGVRGIGPPEKGPLVLLTLPAAVATQVAATSLERPVTVTLR
ncbi:SAF domain-containing protein [Amycolatopsis sp. NPDC059021]|uniref:SAF domain-containing protein n=1 Tax=Amycolatopsis sp. NPDC059021 TaxID=3346704 RepID=UPI00366CB2CE